MKALIFAAGLGTRLKPLTDTIPKALVQIAEKPLLEHIIVKLKHSGFDEIIVNVHHLGQQIIDFLRKNNNFGIHIEVSDEREMLLDTGGGVKKVPWFFNDNKPFLLHNVDILSNVNLSELYANHLRNNALATLIVSKRHTQRYLLFDNKMQMRGWTNIATGEIRGVETWRTVSLQRFAFSGIQILSPRVFDVMCNFPEKFSIIDFYLSQVEKEKIAGIAPHDLRMIDVGKIDVIEEAEKFVHNNLNFEF